MASTAQDLESPESITSLVPARIDRLRWAPFHTRMVAALGIAWVLDGLEITTASAVVAVLTDDATLGISTTQAGAIATVYTCSAKSSAHCSSAGSPTPSVAGISSS